jgi:hypothetical protein
MLSGTLRNYIQAIDIRVSRSWWNRSSHSQGEASGSRLGRQNGDACDFCRKTMTDPLSKLRTAWLDPFEHQVRHEPNLLLSRKWAFTKSNGVRCTVQQQAVYSP